MMSNSTERCDGISARWENRWRDFKKRSEMCLSKLREKTLVISQFLQEE